MLVTCVREATTTYTPVHLNNLNIKIMAVLTKDDQLKGTELQEAIDSTQSDFISKESYAKDAEFLYGEMCSIPNESGKRTKFVAIWYKGFVGQATVKTDFKIAYSSMKAFGLTTYPNKFSEFIPGVRNEQNPKKWDRLPEFKTVS